MPNVIKKYELIMTEAQSNNNKFWRGILYDDGTGCSEWGRVGYDANVTPYPSHTVVEKKMKEKIKKGYTELKIVSDGPVASNGGSAVRNADLHAIARSELLKSGNSQLERIIKRFVDSNVHKITANTQITYNSTTGLFATPLGIVTGDGLVEARNILAQLAPIVRNHKYGANADALLSKYLRIIPQNIGMKKFSAESILPDDNAIQKQSDLIDSLESSYQALQTAKPAATPGTAPKEQVFKVDFDIMSDVRERQRLTNYFERSKKSMHNYDNVRVKEIYQVTIHEMHNGFARPLGNIKEVFHGTSQANCLSILKSGLKVSPPSTAAIAGKMFGNGVYGAINSTKSLGYTFGRWGQGSSSDSGWLFICDFAMGKQYDVHSSCTGAPRGYDSVWAHAGHSLYNDELIVYRNNQVTIKALIETTRP
jgi:poly [ADP-ribose] polymerase 2/3/4